MMRWADLRQPAMLGTMYFAAAATSVLLSRVAGGFAMLWLPTALLVPWLVARKPGRWAPTLISCGAASFIVTGLFGLGWAAAPLLVVANLIEATAAAGFIRRFGRSHKGFASIPWIAVAYAGGGIVGPVLSSLPASAGRWLATGSVSTDSIVSWLIAHALAFIAVFPCAGLMVHAYAHRQSLLPPVGQRRTAALALIGVCAAGAVCFGQSQVPMLFLPILALMFTMVLTDLMVSSAAMAILIVMGIASALFGFGPLRFLATSIEQRFFFLDFYMACLSFTAVPIAVLIERRRRLFAALSESEARYRLLADFSTDIIMVSDPHGTIGFVSPSIRQLGGYEQDAVIGMHASKLIAPKFHEAVEDAYRAVLGAPGSTGSVEFLAVTEGGGLRWFESHLRAVLDEDGAIEGVCSIIRDISHRKRREAELNAVALTDPLTSLANRRAFDLFMSSAGEDATESYIAMFDLDHFKRINDGFGHATGDLVIKAFARAARGVVRDSDLIARVGGEEFALHLHDTTLAQARVVCERIRSALRHEAKLAAPEIGPVSASVGISRFTGPVAAALRRADAALYEAKAAGRDCLAIAA